MTLWDTTTSILKRSRARWTLPFALLPMVWVPGLSPSEPKSLTTIGGFVAVTLAIGLALRLWRRYRDR